MCRHSVWSPVTKGPARVSFRDNRVEFPVEWSRSFYVSSNGRALKALSPRLKIGRDSANDRTAADCRFRVVYPTFVSAASKERTDDARGWAGRDFCAVGSSFQPIRLCFRNMCRTLLSADYRCQKFEEWIMSIGSLQIIGGWIGSEVCSLIFSLSFITFFEWTRGMIDGKSGRRWKWFHHV